MMLDAVYEFETALEQAVLDGMIAVECPHCGEERTLEPDAEGVIKCENCGKEYQMNRLDAI